MNPTALVVVSFLLGIAKAYSGDMTYYETGKLSSICSLRHPSILTKITQVLVPAAKRPKTLTPSLPSPSK